VVNTTDEFERNFDAFVDLHQSRWTGRGEPGVFASRKFSRFHRTLAQKILGKGWLTLFVLYISGEPFSALYGFTYCRKLHFYQLGFRLPAPGRPGDRLRHPGTLIIGLSIRKSIEAGYREFDFLKVHAGSYKDRWLGTRRGIVQIRLARPNPKERIYSAASRSLEQMRRFKRQILKITQAGL
jgi:CelD/BcsL family acetyltransferase involved in cellulose biosynthesis